MLKKLKAMYERLALALYWAKRAWNYEDAPDRIVLPVRFSLNTACSMLSGWTPVDIGALQLQAFNDQTFDLKALSVNESETEALGARSVQEKLFAGYDLLEAVRDHYFDDLPHEVIAAAHRYERAIAKAAAPS